MPDTPRITRSARRRRTVALRVLPDGTLKVQAPLRTSLKWIERFIASRAKWIEQRVAEAVRKKTAQLVVLGEETKVPYLGDFLALGSLPLSVPRDLSPADRQAEIRTALTLWYKKQARQVFAERMAHWADTMKVKPSRLIVTSPARRWGSCNAKNEIRLNWHLIMAAPEILDYVIVHELAHIPHKNHGPAFWRCVALFVPDWKKRREALRKWTDEKELSI